MEGLITLADLPELGAERKPKVTIAIGRLDDNLTDPRYGKFAITQRQVDGWKRNLAETFGGQVAIDFDHSSDRGSGTRAAAWITSIGQEGKLITADVEFSKRGARAVRDGDYKYTSPTFVENYSDEHGVKHGPALIGAALTNRPVLRKGMPTLSLSRDDFEGIELAKVSVENAPAVTAPVRDSRGQMDIEALAKLLDLDSDADEATVLAKVTELKDSTTTETETPVDKKAAKKAAKQARQLASENEDGTIALSADGYAELLSKANAGQAAALQLAEQTFAHAWEKALSEGRAAPSMEENMRELYRQDPTLAAKTLDSFVQIVPTKPKGSSEGAEALAPDGFDQDRFALHTQAKQLATQLAKDHPNLPEDELYAMAALQIDDRLNGPSGSF